MLHVMGRLEVVGGDSRGGVHLKCPIAWAIVVAFDDVDVEDMLLCTDLIVGGGLEFVSSSVSRDK